MLKIQLCNIVNGQWYQQILDFHDLYLVSTERVCCMADNNSLGVHVLGTQTPIPLEGWIASSLLGPKLGIDIITRGGLLVNINILG